MINRTVIVFSLLLCGATIGLCQDKKIEKSCSSSCCKKQTKNIKSTSNQKKGFACRLTTPELQKRKAEVITSLKTKIIRRKEHSNGFSYLFEATESNIDEVTAFIKTERVCCNFFDFKLSVAENELWLTISGEDGAKAFITDEIEL